MTLAIVTCLPRYLKLTILILSLEQIYLSSVADREAGQSLPLFPLTNIKGKHQNMET